MSTGAVSSNSPKLSILIIARDAAAHLDALFESLDGLKLLLAREFECVVLVDSRTQDNTAQIALNYAATVYTETFEGFGAFKEQGRRRCRGRWILNLDVDERPDAELLRAVADVISRDEPFAYSLDIRTYLGQTPTRFGPFAAERRVRLFPRVLGHWDSEAIVHETPSLSVPIHRLPGTIKHLSFKDSADCIERFERYARHQARTRAQPPSLARAISRASWRASRYLLLHGGLLRGAVGVTMAVAIARGTYIKWSDSPPSH